MKLFPLCLSLLSTALLACSCVTIQDARTCEVSGIIDAGLLCSHTNGPHTDKLSLGELLDMITAQPARDCVPVPGFTVCRDDQTLGAIEHLPARGAAIIMPALDWGTSKTEKEVLCRMAGNKCQYGPEVVPSPTPETVLPLQK